MTPKSLAELYFQRCPSSRATPDKIEKELASLLTQLTGRQLFFSINYMSNYHTTRIEESVKCISVYWKEIEPYYELAELRRVQPKEVVYDKTNKHERVDTPSWFREGFDKHLFE